MRGCLYTIGCFVVSIYLLGALFGGNDTATYTSPSDRSYRVGDTRSRSQRAADTRAVTTKFYRYKRTGDKRELNRELRKHHPKLTAEDIDWIYKEAMKSPNGRIDKSKVDWLIEEVKRR